MTICVANDHVIRTIRLDYKVHLEEKMDITLFELSLKNLLYCVFREFEKQPSKDFSNK